MAVAALSPWPSTPAALAAALACLKPEIKPGLADTRIEALGATAAGLVEDFAPGAPATIKNEAVIRCAGWLSEQAKAGIRSETTGDITTDYAISNTGALRYSGAMSLLSPWKVRRAGVIA